MTVPCGNCLGRELLARGFALRRTHPAGRELEHPAARPGGMEKGAVFVSFQEIEDYAYMTEADRETFVRALLREEL